MNKKQPDQQAVEAGGQQKGETAAPSARSCNFRARRSARRGNARAIAERARSSDGSTRHWRLTTQEHNRDLQAEGLALAQRAYQLADMRYREGAADYLTLLDAQRSLINSQDNFVLFELSRYQSALSLYRTLGG